MPACASATTGISCWPPGTRRASRSSTRRCMRTGCTPRNTFARSRWLDVSRAISYSTASCGHRRSPVARCAGTRAIARLCARTWTRRLPVRAIAAPASRNAPCPCGSGRRYKECHGPSPRPAVGMLDRLARAGEALPRATSGPPCVDRARRCCADARTIPLRWSCSRAREAEAGRPLAALALAARRVRVASGTVVPSATVFAVWTALNATFLDAVSGQDARAARSGASAIARGSPRAAGDPGQAIAEVLVVVLTHRDDAVQALASLDALSAQTHRPAELVVVCLGPAPLLRWCDARFQLLPFEATSWWNAAGLTLAAALDAGVASHGHRGSWSLEPPHAFAPAHLAGLVDTVSEQGAQWGFADCTLQPFGAVPQETMAAHRAANDALGTSLAKADALGLRSSTRRSHRPAGRRAVRARARAAPRRLPAASRSRDVGLLPARAVGGGARTRPGADVPSRDRRRRATGAAGGRPRGGAGGDLPRLLRARVRRRRGAAQSHTRRRSRAGGSHSSVPCSVRATC